MGVRDRAAWSTIGLLAKAQKAAFLKDVMAHVTAKQEHQAVSLWDETRVGDPGD